MLILRKFREDDEEEFIKIMFKVRETTFMDEDEVAKGIEKLVNIILFKREFICCL